MSQMRAGAFTHLLVWKIDRISRNLLDFATMYNELKTLGVTFVSKNEQFDTSTAMGEAMLKIILVCTHHILKKSKYHLYSLSKKVHILYKKPTEPLCQNMS